jgi:hypothetical protein
MPAKGRHAVVDRLTDARAGDGVVVKDTAPLVGEGSPRSTTTDSLVPLVAASLQRRMSAYKRLRFDRA